MPLKGYQITRWTNLRVTFSSGGFFTWNKSTSDLADEARKWTLLVECWR
jgi:hypothetical protein